MIQKKALAAIIRQAKRNDERALEILYKSYYDRVFKYMVYQTGKVNEAEDLTQQTFLEAFAGLKGFIWGGSGFTAWLLKIAHNKAMDYFRKSASEYKNIIEVDEFLTSTNEDVENNIINKEQAELLREAIGKLKPKRKQVIEFRFIANLSLKETAIAMKKSNGSVKVLQYRALKDLKGILNDHYRIDTKLINKIRLSKEKKKISI